MKLIESIVAQAPEIAKLRRDLHAHPELCFEEVRTSDKVAACLTQWGIPVHRGIGKTGVVGVIQRGTSNRAIGLRADMDALPISERNHFAHASRHAGKMHACGHDGHTAMLLGAAQHLALNGQFDGTVYLIFQPAEEGGGGARAMMQDGLFERFPMDAIFGMHNWPGLAVGEFAVCSGPVMASSNEFKITVRGKGSHAALPHLGVDPIPIACELVQALQTIITRNKRPIDSAVISVTMIHAGEASNVVPESCELRGTVRTFSVPVLDLIEGRMQEVTRHLCTAHGADSTFTFHRNYPPTINHMGEAEFVRGVMEELVGASRTAQFEPTMGAEDFSFFLQETAGAYFMIGNGDGAHRQPHGLDIAQDAQGPCVLHNPYYDFNDELLPLGGTLWVRLAERWLAVSA